MLKLELDEETIKILKRMIGKETNEQIVEFIKENIGIQEYSYHQVQIFIKLFISQFKLYNEYSQFSNFLDDNVNKKYIKYLAESTKYFTNGGFAKIIMSKKQDNNNKKD